MSYGLCKKINWAIEPLLPKFCIEKCEKTDQDLKYNITLGEGSQWNGKVFSFTGWGKRKKIDTLKRYKYQNTNKIYFTFSNIPYKVNLKYLPKEQCSWYETLNAAINGTTFFYSLSTSVLGSDYDDLSMTNKTFENDSISTNITLRDETLETPKEALTNQFCTIGLEHDESDCQGDTGGPLVFNGVRSEGNYLQLQTRLERLES